jgi:hypothetical protein
MMHTLTPEPLPTLQLTADEQELGKLDGRGIRWLLDRGVNPLAVGTPWAIGAARVVIEPGGLYVPNCIGTYAYILPCIGTGGLIDLVCWIPATGEIASRLGVAAMLGQRQAEEAVDDTNVRPVPVWRSPLSWLRAARTGIVVVDAVRAGHLLSGLVLLAEDAAHAADLRRRLRVRPPRIMIASQQGMAA